MTDILRTRQPRSRRPTTRVRRSTARPSAGRGPSSSRPPSSSTCRRPSGTSATMGRPDRATLPAEIRPHIKVHKSPELARLQVEAGAIGLSCATVWEAIVLVRSGLDHIFVVNTVAGPHKIRALAELAREADVMVAVDDPANIDALSAAAEAAGSELGVLIEIDTGMDRCGVDTPDEALELARRVVDPAGPAARRAHRLRGPLLAHPRPRPAPGQGADGDGLLHRASPSGSSARASPARSARPAARRPGTGPPPTPGVTEIQAGTYVVMDNFHGRMVGGLRALADGPGHGHQPAPRPGDRRCRQQVDGRRRLRLDRRPPAEVVPLRRGARHLRRRPAARRSSSATSSSSCPGYSPSTVNWYDAFHVVEDDVVVDIWPVIPRGPGHHGLIHAERTRRATEVET